jgi:hypothetical protein
VQGTGKSAVIFKRFEGFACFRKRADKIAIKGLQTPFYRGYFGPISKDGEI